MKTVARLGFFAIATLAISAGMAWANDGKAPAPSDGGGRRYVLGSWVNVRSQPSLNAPVVDHVTVNTPVTVVGDKAGDFFEVSYADNKRGYVAASLIGNKPVSLAEIGHEYDANSKPNPAYSAFRAFWLQPTVDRLLAAGKHFETMMLKNGERDAEEKAAAEASRLPKLRRFAIPEFEAMKERLRQGVPGFSGANRHDHTKPMAKWSEIKAIANSNPSAGRLSRESQAISNLHLYWGYRDVPMDVIRELELPITKASYFRDARALLGPFASTESVSAHFDIPYRADVKSGPTWIPAGHYNDGYIFGAWDVGALETRLVSPLHKHTVFRNGKIQSEQSHVPGGRFPSTDADGNGCDVGFSWGDAGTELERAVFGKSQTPNKVGKRLFSLYSRDKMPTAQAKVVSSKMPFSAARFIEAETIRFDLDRDGADDFLVWEGIGQSEQDIHDIGTPQAHYRMAFVNIGGEWHLLLVDEFLYGCGC